MLAKLNLLWLNMGGLLSQRSSYVHKDNLFLPHVLPSDSSLYRREEYPLILTEEGCQTVHALQDSCLYQDIPDHLTRLQNSHKQQQQLTAGSSLVRLWESQPRPPMSAHMQRFNMVS